MPPKKKAKTATTTTRKKKVDGIDAPRSRANLSTKAWSMDGPLGKLPLEILHLVMCELVTDGPKGRKAVFLLLSANKALYTYSLESTTLFFELYHAMQDGMAFSALPFMLEHPLYSPKLVKKTKDTKPLSFSIAAPLPKSAIFDWRQQVRCMVMYLTQRVCVHCQKTKYDTIINPLYAWNICLCLHCCSKFIVARSAALKFNVTAGDTAILQPFVVNMRMGAGKPSKDMTFLCGFQLLALAAQRHGEIKDTRNKPKEIEDAKKERSDMLGTFALLQCGRSSGFSTWHEMERVAPKDIDPGWFCLEFDKCVSRRGYGKNATQPLARLEGKGTPYPTKLRSVEEVIESFGELVIPQFHRYTKGVPGQAEPSPFFLPAEDPGPLVPTEASIHAYANLVQETAKEELYIWSSERSPEVVRAMQKYVSAPTQGRLDHILAFLRAEKVTNEEAVSKGMKITDRLPERKENAKVVEQADIGSGAQASVSELVKAAASHKWPAFAPSPLQTAFENSIVERLAAAEGISKDEARQSRLSRINTVLRAVSVAKLNDSWTFHMDLEKLKWSPTYDQTALPTGPGQIVQSQPFGATYVNALYPATRETERKNMLIDVYKSNRKARASRMAAAVLETAGVNNGWWGKLTGYFCLSGAYRAYLVCPARNLQDRGRVPFKDAFEDVMKVEMDARADLINSTGLVVAQMQIPYDCHYAKETPFCVHPEGYQCWFGHLQLYGTYGEYDVTTPEMEAYWEMMQETGHLPLEM